MKRLLILLLCSSVVPAFARIHGGTPLPAPPSSCGKTVDECQKVVDGLNEQMADLQLAYQFVRRQRDAAQQQLNDVPINAAIQQQQAARHPAVKP